MSKRSCKHYLNHEATIVECPPIGGHSAFSERMTGNNRPTDMAAVLAHELDPKTRVMMQNLLNDAVKAVQQHDPERAMEIEKREKEIWL